MPQKRLRTLFGKERETMRARICGTGSSLPNLRVTNDDLSSIMETSDEWIRSRTGICARHLAVEETTASMAVAASRQALAQAGMQPEDLELIIAATVSADHVIPPLACEVQHALGASLAVAYDISAACAGFIFALHMAQAYIQSGMYRKILIIGAETLSKLLDWSDRSTCVLFGDGAGAAVVCADEKGMIAGIQGSDGSKGMVLSCEGRRLQHPYIEQLPGSSDRKSVVSDSNSAYVQMNGQEVYKFAVRTVPKCIHQVLEKANMQPEEITLYFLHQANLRIIEAVAKRLKQPIDKFPVCLEECGNISAASVPILLDRVNRDGRLKKGDKIMLAGFGAGLTWGAAVLTW